jgi:hypothetical protein
MKGSSERHVEDLYSSADRQYGDPRRLSGLHESQFKRVPVGGDTIGVRI